MKHESHFIHFIEFYPVIIFHTRYFDLEKGKKH